MTWATDVYAQDKICAELCRDMSIVGFGYDVAAARGMSDRLRGLELAARDRADTALGRPITRTKGGGFGTKDLRQAFFEDLAAPVVGRSKITGSAALDVDALRHYAAAGDPALRELSLAILDYRRLRKVRVTYIDNCPVSDDGRVHPSWLNYGAVSGRFACQKPNIMNLPTIRTDPTIEWGRDEAGKRVALNGGIRGLYRAKPGHTLVVFDAKQLEMRIAAYASGDATMIEACAARDLHSANAQAIFGEDFAKADEARRYGLRNLAKQAGFACCYLATAETVWGRLLAEGENVQLRQVEAMLRRLRREFAGYFAWQDQRLLECVRLGYTTTPILGRRRWLGHAPAPTECANFPIQGGAADLMNIRLPEIVAELARAVPGACLVAQVHDSGVFECPAAAAEEVKAICISTFEKPISLASGLLGAQIEAQFPIDVGVSEKWK